MYTETSNYQMVSLVFIQISWHCHADKCATLIKRPVSDTLMIKINFIKLALGNWVAGYYSCASATTRWDWCPGVYNANLPNWIFPSYLYQILFEEDFISKGIQCLSGFSSLDVATAYVRIFPLL